MQKEMEKRLVSASVQEFYWSVILIASVWSQWAFTGLDFDDFSYLEALRSIWKIHVRAPEQLTCVCRYPGLNSFTPVRKCMVGEDHRIFGLMAQHPGNCLVPEHTSLVSVVYLP